MTKVTYIAAPPVDEWKDRSRAAAVVAAQKNYIPYTSLTKGEMTVALQMERAKLMAAYYPDNPYWREAAVMMENALYSGISGLNRIGNVPEGLDNVAAFLVAQGRKTAPASKGAILVRSTPGVKIGDPLVPVVLEGKNCKHVTAEAFRAIAHKNWLDLGAKRFLVPNPKNMPLGILHTSLINHPLKKVREPYQEKYLDCQFKQAVEIVLNARLENASMHMLYHNMAANFEPALGTVASVKRLLHRAAVNDLSNTAAVDKIQMAAWVELGVTRSAIKQNLPPQNSAVLSAYLTPNPELYANKVLNDLKVRGGATGINEVVTITAVTALIAGIAAALKQATELAREFNARKIATLQNAQGFGSDAFSPEKSDYLKPKGESPIPPPKGDNNLLLIGGAAAVLYFATK